MKDSYTSAKSALVVKIEGELDQHSAVELRRSLDERISLGCDNLVFDLGRLEFMDSSGIGVIIGRYKNVTALGGRAAIARGKTAGGAHHKALGDRQDNSALQGRGRGNKRN